MTRFHELAFAVRKCNDLNPQEGEEPANTKNRIFDLFEEETGLTAPDRKNETQSFTERTNAFNEWIAERVGLPMKTLLKLKKKQATE